MTNGDNAAAQSGKAGRRTYSSGHDRTRLSSYLDLLRHYQKNRQFAARHYEIFCRVRDAFVRHGGIRLQDAEILEIGCGQRFPLTLLFHSLGARSVGIDYDYVEVRPSWRGFWAMARRNGPERAVKTLIRSIIFDRDYYRSLAEEFRAPLRFSGVRLRVMDATALQFPERAFDYACSTDVFEHIANVPSATAEMARVLRPGGLAYVGINVFAGISGGHHFEWAEPDTRPSVRVPPWDHLRQNTFPAQVYLNKLRERDYLAIFGQHFEIIESQTRYQGEEHLTEAILRELSDYSRHELLQGSLTVILRKP